MRPAASIDFGSNTVGYLIGRVQDGRFEEVERASDFMRLAEGLRETGRLSEAAIERTLDWVEHIAGRLRHHQVGAVRAVGTEALRLAANSATLRAAVRERLGVDLEVIAGEDEARLTFDGVRLGYPDGPLGVLDIGGGSAELTLGTRAAPPACVSVPLGAVVLTEAAGERWADLRARVAAELVDLPPTPVGLGELTVVGGSGANVALLDQGLMELTDEAVEGHVVALDRVRELRDRVRDRSVAQRIAEFGLPSRRADVIVAAMAVLEGVADRLGLPAMRSSRYSLRHGVLRPMVGAAS